MDLKEAAAELGAIFLAYRSLASATVSEGDGALGGRLLLLTAQEASLAPRAMAARTAGAATLLTIGEAAAAKAALRSGACDFLVTSLDEVLRILKNEVRRGASVTVCLHGTPVNVVVDCIERGVQPDLLEEPSAVLKIGSGLRQVANEAYGSGARRLLVAARPSAAARRARQHGLRSNRSRCRAPAPVAQSRASRTGSPLAAFSLLANDCA